MKKRYVNIEFDTGQTCTFTKLIPDPDQKRDPKSKTRRPIFCPSKLDDRLVETKVINFQWSTGMAKSQKQKSIKSLHENAKSEGISSVLEISTQSPYEDGVPLSPFNLMMEFPNGDKFPVENLFFGSMVFEEGGPYTDMYGMDTYKMRKDDRKTNWHHRVLQYDFDGTIWENVPETAFYDWLYLNALHQNPDLSERQIVWR